MNESLKPDFTTEELCRLIVARAKLPRRDGIVTVDFEDAAVADAALQCLNDTFGEQKTRDVHVHQGYRLSPIEGQEDIPCEVMYIPRTLIPDVKRLLNPRKVAEPQPLVTRPITAEWPRRGSGPNPKASVNNFMVSLAVLEPVFDLCERLDAKQARLDGGMNVYYASRSAYGLKFTSEADALNAQSTFRKILRDGEGITINRKSVNYKTEYWVEVPSQLSHRILSEADSLSKMCEHIAQQFTSGDVVGARTSRNALYDIIDDMGFATGHVAAHMAREAVASATKKSRE